MDDVIRRRGLTRSRRAWSGELGDLRRVVSLVEELANQRITQLLADFPEDEKSERESWKKHVMAIQLEITEKTDSVTGSPPRIVDELDRRTARKIKIFAEFSNSDEKLEVIFQKDPKGGYLASPNSAIGSVAINVRSTNTGWAEQSLAQLTSEVDKAVPRWAVFRSPLGFFVSLAVCGAASYGVLALFEAKHIHKGLGYDLLISLFLMLFGTVLIGGISFALIWSWMFPAFELYGEGGTSSGGRRLGALGTFILSIVAGIIVYLST
jgi:hypothetical protein